MSGQEERSKDAQTQTENGAVAWATHSLADNFEFESQTVTDMVSLLSELWSATGMAPETLRDKTKTFLQLYRQLVESSDVGSLEDANNFLSIYMSFILYKRSVRHGSGRKDESRACLLQLCDEFVTSPHLVRIILEHYFQQGYWKDGWLILERCENLDETVRNTILTILFKRLRDDEVVVEQLNNLDKNASDYEEKKKGLIKQLSNCAKFCPMIRSKKGKTSRDNIKLVLPLAQRLYPEVAEDTWYYANKDGKLDTSSKLTVKQGTPLYFRWRTLLTRYDRFMRNVRKHLPFVEKYMQKGKFKEINPSMLTSANKLRLNDTLRNKPPRYLKPHAKTKIPKPIVEKMRAKYGTETRLDEQDRKLCDQHYTQYEEKVQKMQQEKMEKMAALKKKLAESKSSQNDEETKKLQEELQELQAEKTTNFNAATPVDVYQAYAATDSNKNTNYWGWGGGSSKLVANQMYEACIQELIMGKLADLSELNILSICDTSGSMFGGYGYGSKKPTASPIEVCIAMAAFFAMSAPEGWKHKFIQFDTNPYIRDMRKEYVTDEPKFVDYINFMRNNSVNVQSTNFEGVLLLLRDLFKGANPKDLPRYVVFWSDMQFNQAVRSINKNKTASEQIKSLFVEQLGFKEEDVPTIIFWNLNSHDNRPATASDEGVVMLSGFNPQMILDLHNVVENAVPQAEADAAAQAAKELEQKKQAVNTWTSIVKILCSSEATVPFLEDVKEEVAHTLLDQVEVTAQEVKETVIEMDD